MKAGYMMAMFAATTVALMITVNVAEAAHVSDIIIPVEEETETVKPHLTLNEAKKLQTEPETIENIDEAVITAIETEPETTAAEAQRTEPETTTSAAKAVNLSSSDEQMLLKIAMAEAEDQSTVGKALVMRVVLNRVASKAWPNTVEGVIFQSGQFSPVSNGRYYRVTPNAGCYEALAMVEAGWDESQGAEYFCMAGSSRWHETHLTRLFTNGSHTFYK